MTPEELQSFIEKKMGDLVVSKATQITQEIAKAYEQGFMDCLSLFKDSLKVPYSK